MFFFFFFFDDSLNHNYVILSDIIINILKLMVEYVHLSKFFNKKSRSYDETWRNGAAGGVQWSMI